MSKFFKSLLLLLSAGVFAVTGWADSLIARWDNFTGLTSDNPLAPTYSATVNDLDGSTWTFNRGGGEVDNNGVLATGTGVAPKISFNLPNDNSHDIGRTGTPITVLVAVQLPYTPVNAKPILHIGNGTTGYGLTAKTANNQFDASWQNARWTGASNTAKTIDAMAGSKGTVYLVYSVASTSANAAFTSVALGIKSYSWQTFNGLTGTSVNANQITFGNFVNATSGGLNYNLKSVAVFNGAFAPLEDIQSVIRVWEGVVENDVAATLSGNTAWSEATWTPNTPNNGSNVALTVDAASTLTVNDEIPILTLTANGSAPLTIDGAKLTANATAVNTDVTVNAGSAKLGEVTIAENKTLTVNDQALSVIAGGAGTLKTRGDISLGAFGGTVKLVVASDTFTQSDKLGENHDIVIADGATFEANGHGNYTTKSIQLAGKLQNNRGDGEIDDGKIRFPNISVTGANAKIGGSQNFGTTASSHNNQNLCLNGNTLEKVDGNTFTLSSVTFRNKDALDITPAGTVKITRGKINLHSSSKTSSGQYAAFVMNGGTLDITNKDYSVGSLSGSSDVTLGTKTLTVGALDMDVTYSGVLSGTGAVMKTGRSLWTLSGANTTTGALTISDGKVVLTGSWAGAVTVAADKELSGNGTIGGDLELDGGATIDVAEGPLTVYGGITLPTSFKVNLSAEQAEAESVVLLTAGNVDIAGKSVSVLVDGQPTQSVYSLNASDSQLTLVKASQEAITSLEVEVGQNSSLSDALGENVLAPNANITIKFTDADQVFTFDTAATLGTVTVTAVQGVNGGTIGKGNNTLTIAALDLQTNVTMTLAMLNCVATTDSIVLNNTLTLDQSVITGNIWDNPLNHNFTGSGKLVKTGKGYLQVAAARTCEPTIQIQEGHVRFSEPMGNPYTIEVCSGANLLLDHDGPITNANTTVTLQDGAKLSVWHGNTDIATAAAIKVNDNATIVGGFKGDKAKLTSSIIGSGVLTIVNESSGVNPINFTGVISDKSAEEKLKVVISHTGNGVTFSGANTYTGGTDIAAGAKLTITNDGALGTGAITGAGTLVCNGVVPTNKTNLNDSTKWTGTVHLKDRDANELKVFANSNSALTLEGVQGYFNSFTVNKLTLINSTTAEKNYGFKPSNGTSTAANFLTMTVNSLEGSGTLSGTSWGNTPYYVYAIKDASKFTGVINTNTTNGGMIIVWVGENAPNTVEKCAPYYGSIVVNTPLSISTEGWDAANGIVITENGSLTAPRTITSMLTFEAGATIDATVGVLTANNLDVLPSELIVKVAEAPTVGNPVTILNTTARLAFLYRTAVTVIPTQGEANGRYELIRSGDTLQVAVKEDRIIAGAPLVADEIPEMITLETESFGYGKHAVFTYTGDDASALEGVMVNGLPEGAETVVDGKTLYVVKNRLNVLPIGDSITAGLVKYNGSNPNWHVPGGYRLPLYQYLNQAGYNVNYLGSSNYREAETGDPAHNSQEKNFAFGFGVDGEGNPISAHHEGHSGATLGGGNVNMRNRFTNQKVLNIIATQGIPDVITLHLGTNDLGGTDASGAFTRMKALLARLQKVYPTTKILVANIINRSGGNNDKVNDFNTLLNRYFTSNPMGNLYHVDLNVKQVSHSLLRYDGLHPSTEGYSRMAQNWFAAIEAALPPIPMGAEASIASVDARVAKTLKVTTNKAINTALTQTWTLDNGATVTAAKIADDKRTAILTVEDVAANTEYTYTLTATNLFVADDSVVKTFSTTADIHTPKTDVVEGERTGDINTASVLKAAEWTTFAGFATGYTSPIGYMPESGRPWSLMSDNAQSDANGALALDGALTVNVVDGRIGTTVGTYTVVMQVSNLSEGSVLFTDSAVECWEFVTQAAHTEISQKGTTVADLFKITVGDADSTTSKVQTLKVQYKENSEKTVSLTGVDLSDAIPEVIAVVVKNNVCSFFVNGTKVATDVPLGTAISESYRGNFTIGDAGSSMKLHRLSFYEGEVTAIAAPFATTATLDVGTGAGQYSTWKTAKAGLNLADQMESLTINFTAADQTFTFDNTDAVALGAVSVTAGQGVTGGTIVKTGAGALTKTSFARECSDLTLDASVFTMAYGTGAQTIDGWTLGITVPEGQPALFSSVFTVKAGATFKKVGAGTLTLSGANNFRGTLDVLEGTLIANGETNSNAQSNNGFAGTVSIAKGATLQVDGADGSDSLAYGQTVNVDVAGTLNLDTHRWTLGANTTLTLRPDAKVIGVGQTFDSILYGALDWNEKAKIKVSPDGGSTGTATLSANIRFRTDSLIDIDEGMSLILSGNALKNNADKTLEKSGAGTLIYNMPLPTENSHSVSVTKGTMTGTGVIGNELTMAEGTTLALPAEGLLTVNETVTLPAQLAITLPNNGMPTEGKPVTILYTSAFADAVGYASVSLTVNGTAADEYVLYKTAEAVELRYAPWTTVTSVTASDDVNTWSEVLADMEAKRQRFDTTANPSLIIDFGSGNEPGIFTFDLEDATVLTLAKVTIQGSAGGTIQKSGTANVTATATEVNTNVEIAANAMLLGQTTLAANCTLTVNDSNALGNATNFSAGEGSTVKLVDVDKSTLNLANLTNAAGTSNLILNNVKAYIYDCKINTLTLEGDFQINNGTSAEKKTQCITVNALAGAGIFKGPEVLATGLPICTAINVKDWTDFTGSLDLSHENAKKTIFFFGTAPQRFTDAAGNANTADDAQKYFENDYGTVYVTAGTEEAVNTVATDADSTWKLQKLVVEANAAFQIKGWATIATSCTGNASVEDGGVLDLRTLTVAQLEAINVTVKAGGRVLVNTGASVPDTIVFEAGSILGVATTRVEDVGNATLTVNVDGSAAANTTIIKGYHVDGVTELDNWTKNESTSSGGELKFNFDPVFDGELCWWAYEFDADENTTNTTKDTEKIGPMSSGRDKTRMSFDGWTSTGRVFDGDEYPGDGTIRVASAPHREVDYPTAFTAAMYGKLTNNTNRILMGFGSTYHSKYAVVLATGASAGEIRLLLVEGHTGDTHAAGTWPETPVTTLVTTTVPNASSENHLYAFSYEQFDSDENETLDSTRIIFYVDGEKYQPFTAKAIIPLGGGFQMASIHGGWPTGLMRMTEADEDSVMDYLRVYNQILPENVLTAMAKEYAYISKVGRAERTIVAGADTTWHEITNDVGDWTQTTARKENGDYVYADGQLVFDTAKVDAPTSGTEANPELGTQVVLNVSGNNTLYLNEFYSTTTDPETGDTSTNGNSKLYYERLEINPVNQSGDSLTMWAGRLNPAIEKEDPLKNSQSAVITVQGYTKINTNVTMAHNVAYLSGPVAVAEGKTLTFDFSGFDVMKVPAMPTEYRLTGFLDEETRDRVKHNFRDDDLTKNARSVDLSYKTDVNQYTFKVDRYPVTAYFRNQDDVDLGADGVNASQTPINFNDLYYMWQGLAIGKRMDWDVDTVDADGNHVDEHVLANFVSVDAETKQPKIVTVTLDSVSDEAIYLTLPEAALKKTVTHGDGDDGNPIWEEVNMLGAEQLIVGDKVTVDYTGANVSTLAPFVKDVVGMVKATAMGVAETTTEWRGNLTLDNGEDAVAIAGTNTVSGKLVLGKSITLAAGATISAKDADFTAVKEITVDYEEAVAAGTYKVVGLEAGHTAKSLEGCTVTAVDGEGATVATWTETEGDKKLVVIRGNGLYVVARPSVTANSEVVANDGLTLPLARRAAELGATSLNITAVKSLDGKQTVTTDAAVVAVAAECFTGIAFDAEKEENSEVATATLRYNFGVTDITVVVIGDTQYVVAELVVSNAADLANNSADYADGVTVDVVVKKGEETQTLPMTPVADMTGAETMPATVEKAKRYIRFQMPTGNDTFKIKARAVKSAQ